jgi:hypothetical protein
LQPYDFDRLARKEKDGQPAAAIESRWRTSKDGKSYSEVAAALRLICYAVVRWVQWFLADMPHDRDWSMASTLPKSTKKRFARRSINCSVNAAAGGCGERHPAVTGRAVWRGLQTERCV